MEETVQLHPRFGHVDVLGYEGVVEHEGHVDDEGDGETERVRSSQAAGGEGARPNSGCRAW